MLLTTLSFSAGAATAVKTVTVPGVGLVAYSTVSDGEIADETGEWYHAHITYSGSSKDFRLVSNAKFGNLVYYVSSHPVLPGRNTANVPINDSLNFKLYGTSKMSFYDFWKNEGLTAKTVTNVSSPVKDPEGYNDLGGFDTVVRSTLTFGVSHTSFAYDNEVHGYEAVASTDASGVVSYNFVEDGNGDPVPLPVLNPTFRATGFSGAYASVGAPKVWMGPSVSSSGGHASSEAVLYNRNDDGNSANDKAALLSHYDILGMSDMPVSVAAVDYIENLIAKDAGQTVPATFSNFRQGGELVNLWDEVNTATNTRTVAVDSSTGLLKNLNKDGEYGSAQEGKSEMSYEVEAIDGGSHATSVSMGYDTGYGDYADANIALQLRSLPTTSVPILLKASGYAPYYYNYVYNFIGARYDYYGDVKDIAGISDKSEALTLTDLRNAGVNLNTPKASYGTAHGADTWWAPQSKKAQTIELGFNFYSIRLGGSGQDTTSGGIYQQGSARDKAGFYRVTLYSLGHKNIESLVYIPARYFTLSQTAATLAPSASKQLTADIQLETEVTNPITWESSDDSVATVDETGKITAVAVGSAKITAKVVVGADRSAKTYTSDCEITVAKPAVTPPLTPAQKATIKLNASKATLYHKGSKSKTTLKATVTGASKTVTWKSSNTKVATVKNGVVTAKAKGTTTISATANGVTAKATITVKNAALKLKKSAVSIKKGKTYAIKATVTPKATVTYKSSNKKIVTVSKKGVIKGKKKGKATITVKANGIVKKLKVTVKKK
jgi:uncharacterized protein YjdB